MAAARKTFQKSFLLLFIFHCAVFAAFLLSNHFIFPNESAFLNWDAMHYKTIRDHGYATGMVAFFPLFPLFWKITFAGSIGISLLNGLIYISSMAWLANLFNIDSRRLLLLASIPSLIFMFLPFSEAVFFLSCAIVLVGMKRKHQGLLFTGILLASLARPVATVFIPAFIILHFLTAENLKGEWQQTVKMILACILVLLVVFFIQYVQTGEWFSFLKVQREWGNYLRLPVFPLSSWAGGFIVRLDAMAFLSGSAAGIYILYLITKKIKSGLHVSNRAFIFSLCYLAMMSLIVLFTRGGVLNSLNRYLFCSAFFIVALNELLASKIFTGKKVLLLFLTTGIFWLQFGSYVHIQTLLKFMLLSVYIILLFCITAENRLLKNAGYFGVITCNIFFMLVFFNRFFNGEWVG